MQRVGSRFLVTAMATLLATGWITATPLVAVAAGTISLTAINTAYTQDFNTLASLGTSCTGHQRLGHSRDRRRLEGQ